MAKSKNYLIRMYVKSNPSINEYSKTNNVKQRLNRLVANFKAINGQGADSLKFERFVKFTGYPIEDIGFEVASVSLLVDAVDVK